MLHWFSVTLKRSGYTPILVLGLGLLLTVSCEKNEGFGGTASISGSISEQLYNDDYSLLIHERPAVDEEVFIVFGEEKALGNRVRTNHQGQFMFKYLYPGNYEVYFMSDDSSAVLGLQVEKSFSLELGRGEDLDMGELHKLTPLDFDEGTATIRGRVRVTDYVDTSVWPNLVIEKSYYGTEQEVYLTYGEHSFYDERIRSQHDGTFEFGKLIPGDYLVVLYSDDVKRESDKVAVTLEVSITSLEQVVDLGDIVIEKF